LYIGVTSDVKKRVEEHNRGYNQSTRSRIPFELFYVEEVGSRSEARVREKFFKSGRGREFLRARLAGK
jgi:putative endonuclease